MTASDKKCNNVVAPPLKFTSSLQPGELEPHGTIYKLSNPPPYCLLYRKLKSETIKMLEVRKVQLQLKGKQLYVQAWLCTILPIWNVLTRYSASQSFTTRSQWNKR